MKIVIGGDHTSIDTRQAIVAHFEAAGISITDVGSNKETSNYALCGIRIGESVVHGTYDLGIAICGSGIGISIAANKVIGIRAALIRSENDAQMARAHNDANVICFGARVDLTADIIKMVEVFLNTKFEGDRHIDRINTILYYEESCCAGC